MAGAYRTTSDLVTAVLGELNVLSVGQPPDSDDQKRVTDNLDSIFRLLDALDIASLGDINNIPGEAFMPLVYIVAGEVCSFFGADDNDRRERRKNGLGVNKEDGGDGWGSGRGAMMLKAIMYGRPTYERATPEYM